LKRPFYFPKPGKASRNDYLGNRGIYVILNVKRNNLVKKIDSRRKGNPLVYLAYKIRQRLKEITAKNLSSLSGSVLNALILGLRQELPERTREALVNTGTVHIIAISGLHLGIFGFIVLLFLKALQLPRAPRYLIAIITLWGYCILTGSNLPAMRAAIMATVFLAGLMIRRQPDTIGSLSLAALIILAINPGQLFEVSFQLSFLSIISLVFIAPKIRALFFSRLKKTRAVKPLVNIFSSSLGAWLGLSPLILYYFRIISPVAILGNMVIVPYMALVIACGVSFLLAGLFFPALISIFSPAAELSILLLLKFISLLERIPFGYFRPF
ncbi:MAG: ComEC/Rec2 family competence protein, partial [Candidatus Omnitrophota bacterium]|nr:ComEC/Rec2 family competence protein [Candidatus Omnitrophota bacterium]